MRTFFKYPWLIVALIGAVTVFFALQLPRAELDNNNLRFVPEDDEARRVSAEIDDTFGSSLFILVALERREGSVFEEAFLRRLRDFVDRVEGIGIVDPVTSMVSSDYITGADDAILVEKLVPPEFSGSGEEIAVLKERLLSWGIYRRSLISDDFSATQVLVPLNIPPEDAGDPEVVASFIHIRDMAREMFAGIAEVYVTGLPVISATINEAVRADLLLMVPLVILVVLVALFFSFRRLSAVLLPTLTVVVAVIWSMGAMPLFGVKLSVISTVLPVILVAVGSAYGIHVVTHYLGEGGNRGGLDRAAHREFIFSLLRRIGRAVFLAALTTFVGFLSFCFTRVLPIREFGFFSSFGVIASFVVALTLIPALLLIRGPRGGGRNRSTGGVPPAARIPEKAPPRGRSRRVSLNAALAAALTAIVRRKKLVLLLTGAVLACSVWGLSRLVIDNIFVEYFREDTDISRSDRFIREKFGGSKVVSVVAAADTETLLLPKSLLAMDGLSRFLEEEVAEVGKVMGFTDLIKRINQVFYADMPGDFYEIPGDPAKYGARDEEELGLFITNYLLLLGESTGSYADDPLEPQAIKTTVQLHTLGEEDTGRAIARIRDYAAARFPPELKVTIGGSALVEASLNSLVVQSQLISVFVSLFLVFVIISVSNRSLTAGCVGIIPLGITIMINFAVMGFLGIKLNIGTSMVASLSVGIGIDYTIHYMEAFKREFRRVRDQRFPGGKAPSLRELEQIILPGTFTTSGKAIIINAVSVGLGFAVLLFSRFVMLEHLGLLIALTMGTSALVSLTVIPALLVLFNPKFIRGEENRGEEY
jgi:predicted RND superfamily exporter protein